MGLAIKMDGLRDKKILVTGASGFLGSHLVDALHARGDCVVHTVSHSVADLTKKEDVALVLRVLKPDTVIHLAAVCGGIGANQAEPGRFFYENMMMGLNMIEESRKSGVKKFVQVGTVCSYPKFCPVPFKEEDIWNGYPEETNAPYGIAKKALLVQLQAYRQQYGFNGIYLIPVNMYGPRDNFDPQTSHVIPALIRKCVEAKIAGKDVVEVWGSGTATREFLYVKDAVTAILKATVQYDKPEPVNLGSGYSMPITNLCHSIGVATDFWGTFKFVGGTDGQPKRELDISLALKEFEFEAYTPFATGIKETLEWYLENPSEHQQLWSV
jgi:GDP-L-fucose synthase